MIWIKIVLSCKDNSLSVVSRDSLTEQIGMGRQAVWYLYERLAPEGAREKDNRHRLPKEANRHHIGNNLCKKANLRELSQLHLSLGVH